MKLKKHITVTFPRALICDGCIISSQCIIDKTHTPVTYLGKTIGQVKNIYKQNGDLCIVLEIDSNDIAEKDYDSLITDIGVI